MTAVNCNGILTHRDATEPGRACAETAMVDSDKLLLRVEPTTGDLPPEVNKLLAVDASERVLKHLLSLTGARSPCSIALGLTSTSPWCRINEPRKKDGTHPTQTHPKFPIGHRTHISRHPRLHLSATPRPGTWRPSVRLPPDRNVLSPCRSVPDPRRRDVKGPVRPTDE